jgi:hypothetical protein
VEQEDLGVGVVEQVGELVVELAVVDVDVDGPRLEGGELRLEVLVGVEEVERDRPPPRRLRCSSPSREPTQGSRIRFSG